MRKAGSVRVNAGDRTYEWIWLFLELALGVPAHGALPRRVQYQKVQRAGVQYERCSGLLVTQDGPRQREDGLFDRIHIRVRSRCFL